MDKIAEVIDLIVRAKELYYNLSDENKKIVDATLESLMEGKESNA